MAWNSRIRSSADTPTMVRGEMYFRWTDGGCQVNIRWN